MNEAMSFVSVGLHAVLLGLLPPGRLTRTVTRATRRHANLTSRALTIQTVCGTQASNARRRLQSAAGSLSLAR